MRKAIRSLTARPGFAAVTVATLALGFGVNAAIFSLTRTVLLRPLPYGDADRLVMIAESNRTRGVTFAPAVPANYTAWRERTSSFEDTAAWRFVYFTLSGATTVRVQGLRVAASFFPLLGVSPSIGRGFQSGEDTPGRDEVVVLSDGFWRRQFGGDPRIVGTTLTVDGVPCTVVGVLPQSFRFFRVLNRELDVWRPLVLDPSDREHSIQVYAKLKATASLEGAQAELAALYATLPGDSARDGWTADVSTLSARFTAASRPILTALEWAVALVMCIACANIANLVLAAAAERRRDIAVRVALGATRWRLTTERYRETLALAGAGAMGGLLLAVWIVDVLNGSVSYQDINRIEPFRVDLWVVGFTLAIAMACAFVFALLPTGRAVDRDVIDALKDSSHGATPGAPHRRLRAGLVVAELALSIVLLTVALALTRHAWSLHAMTRGLNTSGVLTAQLSLNGSQYDDARRLTQFADAVLGRVTASPGVETASLVNYPPLSAIGLTVPVAIDAQPQPAGHEPQSRYWVVAPRYFSTVGIPIVAGRDFTAADSMDRAGVAVVSERFARRFWGRASAIGEHVTVFLPHSDAFWIPRSVRRPLTVVGVVGDVREDGLPTADLPQIYLPYSQNPTRILTVVVRASGPTSQTAALIRESVRSADPDQPTFDERLLDEVRRETFARPRELAWLVGTFAGLALVLSAIGVYGVVSHLTAARGREIGIRVALGATPVDVVRLIVGDAMKLAGLGILIGAAAVPLGMRVAGASIVGAGGWNPLMLVVVSALLATVCAAAAALPARRAAHGTRRNPRM